MTVKHNMVYEMWASGPDWLKLDSLKISLDFGQSIEPLCLTLPILKMQILNTQTWSEGLKCSHERMHSEQHLSAVVLNNV